MVLQVVKMLKIQQNVMYTYDQWVEGFYPSRNDGAAYFSYQAFQAKKNGERLKKLMERILSWPDDEGEIKETVLRHPMFDALNTLVDQQGRLKSVQG